MAEPTAVLAAELSADPSKLIDGFKRAEQATGAWAQAAQRNMTQAQASFGGLDFSVVTSKARAETLKMVELEHQLTVARAAGEKETVAQLTEEIALLQKVRQLRSAGLAQPEAMTAAKAHFSSVAAAGAAAAARQAAEREAAEAAEAAAARRERVVGNPGEALAGVFSRSRLTVLEEGSAKVPIFGSTLEALGASGLIAAGGLAAAGTAIEMVVSAAERSEEIENTAKRIGVTTQALQEFQFAAVASGVSAETMNEALAQGNKVLGDFQSNIASGKTKKLFEALGITQEEARKAQSITDLIPELAEKLGGLGTTQQDSLIQRLFGSTDLVPFFQRGAEGIQDLRREAEETGAVFDHDLIEKGSQLAEKLKLAHLEVDTNLKRAFVELAPLIARCADLIAGMARGIGNTLEDFGPIARFSSTHVADDIKAAQTEMASTRPLVGRIDPKTGRANQSGFAILNPFAQRYNVLADQLDQLRGRQRELGVINQQPGEVHTGSTQQLVADKPKRPKAAPADTTSTEDASAQSALDGATKDLASALQERGAAERKAVDAVGVEATYRKAVSDAAAEAQDKEAKITADLNDKLDKLNADEVKVRKDVHDAHQVEQIKTLEAARAKDEDAALQRSLTASTEANAAAEKAARQRLLASLNLAAEALENSDRYAQSVHQVAQGYSDGSSAAKLRINLQNLSDQKRLDDDTRQGQRQQELGQVLPNAAGAQEANQRINEKYDTEQSRADTLYQSRVELAKYQDVSPFEEWAREGTKSIDQVHDALESAVVKGFDDVNHGIADAIANGRSMGDVFKSVFRQMESDALSYLLKQAEIGVFGGGSGGLNLGSMISTGFGLFGGGKSAGLLPALSIGPVDDLPIPAFATGTDGAPGGLTRYDDIHGVEGFVPPGAQIIPNSTLQGLAQLTPDRLGSGGGVMNHNISIDLTGANGDETIREIAHQAAAAGTLQAISYSSSKLKNLQRAPSRDLSRF